MITLSAGTIVAFAALIVLSVLAGVIILVEVETRLKNRSARKAAEKRNQARKVR